MRRLAIFLAVLALLAALADFGARLVVQNLAGRALASQRGVNGSVDVSFGGFPFLLHLMDRRFSTVTVSAEDVRSGGFGDAAAVGARTEARIASIDFELRDVAVRGELWRDDPDRVVTADSGTGTASVSGAELNRLVPDEHAATVRLLDGRVRVTVATPAGEQSAEASDDAVRVEGGSLVIEAPAPLRPLAIPLPSLVAGTRFEDVEVRRGFVELTFSLTEVTLEL